MAKQHEVLAIKSGILGKVTELLADLHKTFTSKQQKFGKKTQVVTYLDETKKPETVHQLALETTVPSELAWIGAEFAKLLDISHTINSTNTVAKADVVVGGTTLLTGIPATGLLELEKYALQLKATLKDIPTLDGSCAYAPDKDQGFGVHKAREVAKTRTQKENYVMQLTKATDKFAETVQVMTRDVVIANITEHEWSGFITVADKSALLSRIEDFIAAVKQAQARANSTETIGEKIGAPVLNYIFGSLIEKPIK